jgi:hypothetical protein
MTEEEVYDKVMLYLDTINNDAAIINPAYDKIGKIIRAHQNAPRPVGDYAALNLLSHIDLAEVNCDIYRDQVIGGANRVVFSKARGIEWLFRVEVYASRPTDVARLFQTALRSDYTSLLLSPLVVRMVDDVTRTPEMIQQRWEGRANLDFSVAGVVTESLLIDHISEGKLTANATDYSRLVNFQRI